MKKIMLCLLVLVLVLVGCTPRTETVVLYKNVNKTVNVTVIKEVNRTIIKEVNKTIFEDCPITNLTSPLNIECEDVENYKRRMYGCERKVAYYENLNTTYYQDNLTTELDRCTAELLQANYTLNQIRRAIE